MKKNYLTGFVVAAALLALLAFVAHSLLEIYPRTKYLPLSREARMNEYLALDRWLNGMGIPVRTESFAGFSIISAAPERRIFIQSSLFSWSEESVQYLVNWVEEGGELFLSLDHEYMPSYSEYFQLYEDGPLLLLEEFGIEASTQSRSFSRYDPEAPNYDIGVSLDYAPEFFSEGEDFALTDSDGVVRLIRITRGKGKFTITGHPYFLRSNNLNKAANARLAGALFAADKNGNKNDNKNDNDNENEDEGCLFIRGTTRGRGLVGSLFRQGNLLEPCVAGLVLLVVCFWMVIPGFGVVRGDNEKPGKPLRERFLAEGLFLKRYGALNFYRESYLKEIKRRFARKEGILADEAIQGRVLEILGKSAGQRDCRIFTKVLHGENISRREFPRMITIFNTILERI